MFNAVMPCASCTVPLFKRRASDRACTVCCLHCADCKVLPARCAHTVKVLGLWCVLVLLAAVVNCYAWADTPPKFHALPTLKVPDSILVAYE